LRVQESNLACDGYEPPPSSGSPAKLQAPVTIRANQPYKSR
jgi:hypothetical protein